MEDLSTKYWTDEEFRAEFRRHISGADTFEPELLLDLLDLIDSLRVQIIGVGATAAEANHWAGMLRPIG